MKPLTAPYILICAAVEQEIAGLKIRLDDCLPCSIGFAGQMLQGRISGKEIMLLITGPGLVNTAHALTAAIEHRRPGLIIQTGCAGIFPASGLRIGDIGVATEEIDAQLGSEALADDRFPLISPLPFPTLKTGAGEYFNQYPVDEYWTGLAYQHLVRVFSASNIRVGKGPFITVSTVTATNDRAKLLHDAYQPCMEQMEGSASAHIAVGYGIPFVEIRSASNLVGRRDKKTWDLPQAFRHACMAVYEFLQIIEASENGNSIF
jgi:futalosine hydrolase